MLLKICRYSDGAYSGSDSSSLKDDILLWTYGILEKERNEVAN
jgi:hypothetical protein